MGKLLLLMLDEQEEKTIGKIISTSSRYETHREAVLYCNGDSAKSFYPLYWKSKFQPYTLPEDTF